MQSAESTYIGRGLTEQDLQKLMDEKHRFNREILDLSEPEATDWAQRTVEVFRKAFNAPGAGSK